MISAIITTFNRGDLLRNAIQSILDQSYKNIEIIVVDDASNNDNELIIKQFQKNIIFYKFNKNMGGNICRNKGVELASSRFIAFLDDDDTWNEYKIEEQLNILKKTNCDMVYTGKNIIELDKNLERIKSRYSYINPAEKENLKKSIMKSNFIGSTSSIMISKDIFLKVNGFDVNMPAQQDYEFYIRIIFANAKVIGIDKPLLNYFIYNNIDAISKNHKKNILATIIIIKKNYYNNYFFYLIIFRITNIAKRYAKDWFHL